MQWIALEDVNHFHKNICRIGKMENIRITYVTDRAGHDMCYTIDPAKLQRELD